MQKHPDSGLSHCQLINLCPDGRRWTVLSMEKNCTRMRLHSPSILNVASAKLTAHHIVLGQMSIAATSTWSRRSR